MDINPAMHELARKTCADPGVEDVVSYDVEDVHRLGYPSGFADLVTSYSCFHHWADPVQGLRECMRILRPGGVLHLVDTNGTSAPPLRRSARPSLNLNTSDSSPRRSRGATRRLP